MLVNLLQLFLLLLATTVSAKRESKVSVILEGNRRKCFLEEMTVGTVLMSISSFSMPTNTNIIS